MSTLDELMAERKRIDAEIKRLTSEIVINSRIKLFPKYKKWHLAILTDGCNTDSWKEIAQFPNKDDAKMYVDTYIKELTAFKIILEESEV